MIVINQYLVNNKTVLCILKIWEEGKILLDVTLDVTIVEKILTRKQISHLVSIFVDTLFFIA